MHAIALLALGVFALIPATPVVVTSNQVEARAPFVTCKPNLAGSNMKIVEYKVDVARARTAANTAGFERGRSSYPHRYEGRDRIVWGSQQCDGPGAILYEYPVYWESRDRDNVRISQDFAKDVKNKAQRPSTPSRSVYANVAGAVHFCGVMTHAEVTEDNRGHKFFRKCV